MPTTGRKRPTARQPRFSAPNVRAPRSANAYADIQLDRFRRESTGAVGAYSPGDVQPLAEYVADVDDPEYEFPLWWF